MTTVPLRNSRRPFRNSALWLWSSWLHHDPTTNSGSTTVTMLFVYRADGTLAGASPALLGRTRGDHSVAGVGERTQSGRLRPGDDTTPAGRFETEPGRNNAGESIVWIDYAAALAIHRLRPGPGMSDRAHRLATPGPHDNRASAGCVVVPAEFYATVVQPLLGQSRGVVYVMPEQAPTDNRSLLR